MSRLSRSPAPNSPAAPRRRFITSSIVAVCVVAIGLWWYTSSWRWIRQASTILPSDPAQADALAEAALNTGTGRASQAWLIRCRAQLALEHPLEALGAFAQITEPDQCNVTDWCALIEEAQAAHHTILADMALSQALRFRVERARVLTLALPVKANSLSEREVSEFVQELRRLAGPQAGAWRAIGTTEQARGRLAEALEAYHQAVALSDISQPIGVLSRRELAQLLISIGQFTEAEPLVTEVIQASAALSQDQLRLAQLRRSAGDCDGAQTLLDEVLVNEPENLPARLLRGTLRAEQKQLAEAQADFEQCLRISPFHDEAHYRLSQILLQKGDSSGADKHLRENRRLSELKLRIFETGRRRATAPQDPQLMDEMADLYKALGQPNKADEWHRAAKELRRLQSPRP